jgi:hypothetical protein
MEVRVKSFKRTTLLICFVFVIQMLCSASQADYIPWDELTENWWIDFADGDDPNMYPVNAADSNDIAASYSVSFLEESEDDRARGMNALKFVHGGLKEGHMVSKDLVGSFSIINTGDSNRFANIFILIAIADDSLDIDFSMTLNLQSQPAYEFGQDHFVYYDGFYGRPSGFYSATDPNIEHITYAHNSAMVTVYGVSGMLDPLGYKNDPLYSDTITIEYSFNYLSAPVVFSVYGLAPTTGGPEIYHTNRAIIDKYNSSKKVSTFAVTIAADVNSDLKVNLEDIAMIAEYWLVGAR